MRKAKLLFPFYQWGKWAWWRLMIWIESCTYLVGEPGIQMHVLNHYAKLSSYASSLKHLQFMIWRNEMIVFSFVVNSVISYLVTIQNSNSCPSFNHKCSAMFLARYRKCRIRGHMLICFHFQGIGVGFFSPIFIGAQPFAECFLLQFHL